MSQNRIPNNFNNLNINSISNPNSNPNNNLNNLNHPFNRNESINSSNLNQRNNSNNNGNNNSYNNSNNNRNSNENNIRNENSNRNNRNNLNQNNRNNGRNLLSNFSSVQSILTFISNILLFFGSSTFGAFLLYKILSKLFSRGSSSTTIGVLNGRDGNRKSFVDRLFSNPLFDDSQELRLKPVSVNTYCYALPTHVNEDGIFLKLMIENTTELATEGV